MHAPAPDFNEKEHVQALQPGGLDGEEIDRDDAARMRAYELAPRQTASAGRSEAGRPKPRTDPQALAQEAIERLVNCDDWFLREVEKGLAQVDRGETLSHEEVGARLEQRLTEQTRRR